MTEVSENPYSTPNSELLPEPSSSVTEIPMGSKLYTPMQVKIGAFAFGPLAGLWFLRANSIALGKPDQARRVTIIGLIVCAAILALLPFLPERFPRMVIPITYTVLAGQIADIYQLKKPAILESGRFEIQSNWLVTGIGFAALGIFFILAMALIFGLSALGLIHLA